VSDFLPNYTEIWGDRRSKRRYPINLPGQIRLINGRSLSGAIAGNVLNMSSQGVAFASEGSLCVGALVELSVSWPVLLHGNTPVKMVIQGNIVRTEDRIAVVEITRYEFRTQKR
jgi:hypothetical protein